MIRQEKFDRNRGEVSGRKPISELRGTLVPRRPTALRLIASCTGFLIDHEIRTPFPKGPNPFLPILVFSARSTQNRLLSQTRASDFFGSVGPLFMWKLQLLMRYFPKRLHKSNGSSGGERDGSPMGVQFQEGVSPRYLYSNEDKSSNIPQRGPWLTWKTFAKNVSKTKQAFKIPEQRRLRFAGDSILCVWTDSTWLTWEFSILTQGKHFFDFLPVGSELAPQNRI